MMKKILLLSLYLISLNLWAEKLELFEAIPGAILYEIEITSESDQSKKLITLETPILDTDQVESGSYIMIARYKNVRGNWSAWTDKASLKIVKKMKSNTRDIFDDTFPFGGSLGFSNLTTKLDAKGVGFRSNESVVRSRGFIQKKVYKIAMAYDQSSNLSRFDIAILKQLTANFSAGVNFWIVNFDARTSSNTRQGIINYTQSFIELDYMYPFWDRWYIGSKFGLGLGLSYYARPELTYSVPFGDKFFASASVLYENSRVKQSDFEFNSYGLGGMLNISYFLEI